MDYSLRCNYLKCRTELRDQAVVTSCSHIFCLSCAESSSLSGRANDRRCPACQASLVNSDDAAGVQLNPSDEFRTMVLSGLNPSTIMECASRALSFWSYQATQEILYQEHMAKNWNVKASELTADVENILNEANTEISGLQNKLAGLQLDKEGLERKHSEVVEALKEKTKKHRQTQELYDKLKRKTLYSQVQTATSEIVEQAANDDNAMMGELFVDDGYGDTGNQRSFGAPRAQHQQPQQGPFVYDQNHPQLRTERETVHGDEGNMAPPIMRRGPGIQIGANQNFRSKPQALSPSRRVSLSNEGRRNVNSGFAATPNSHVGGLRSSTLQNMTPKHRQPLMTRNNNPQRTPSIAGYGMSAGMKVGRSFDGSVNHQEQNKLGGQRAGAGTGFSASLQGGRSYFGNNAFRPSGN